MNKKDVKNISSHPFLQVLSDRVNPAFILLYGSHAKGTAREDSDIDLAYYEVHQIPLFNAQQKAENLNEKG